ncbi:hypothetical protein IGI04_034434, partial [Brassica rapa subsp. trilocularis]
MFLRSAAPPSVSAPVYLLLSFAFVSTSCVGYACLSVAAITGRVLRGSLIMARVHICAGSEAAVEEIGFPEFEDCSRVSVSFVCFVFSRNCLEFPFQGLGCPLPFLWHGCVRGPRLFLARRRSFYWFSVGEYVRGCGGLRFGLSESSCLCGVVLETVKFWSWRSPLNLCLGSVGVTVVLAISFPNKELSTTNGLSLCISVLSMEAVVIFCCGGTDVVVASYFSGEAAAIIRCGRSDVVVASYFSSKVAAFLRYGGTDVVVVSYFPGEAAVILRCGGSDVVVASYFSSKAAVFFVVAGLMWLYLRTFPERLREAATCLCHGWIDVVGVFYLLSRREGVLLAYRSKA